MKVSRRRFSTDSWIQRDLLAESRHYNQVSLQGATWSFRIAVENWLSAVDATYRTDLRERFESLNASTFGVRGIPVQNYLLDRELIHADVRPNQNWQIFVQLQDDYAPGNR